MSSSQGLSNQVVVDYSDTRWVGLPLSLSTGGYARADGEGREE